MYKLGGEGGSQPVRRRRENEGKEEKGRKGEKREKRKERKERKMKIKREIGRRLVVSSSVH